MVRRSCARFGAWRAAASGDRLGSYSARSIARRVDSSHAGSAGAAGVPARADGWAASGWEEGPLGYPITDATCGLPGGGCWQAFEDGDSVRIDAMDKDFQKVASLKLFKAEEGDAAIYGGVLTITGMGAWAVSCDPDGGQ